MNVNIVVCRVIGPAAAVLLGAAAREQCAEESRSVDWCRPSVCDVVTHHSRAHCRVPPPPPPLLLLLLLILISLSVGAPCRRPACVCVCVVHRSAACLCVHASPPARPPRALAYSRRVIVVCRTRNGRCVTSQPRARVCDVTVTSPSRSSSSMWCCRWRTATERRVSRRAPVAHSHAHILTRHT